MGITREQSNSFNNVCLEGSIDVTCARDLQSALVAALETGLEVRVSIAGGSELDVTAIQLLYAASREARESGLKFSITTEAREAISLALADAGFAKFPLLS